MGPLLLYPPLQRSWKGVYWFHVVRPSIHLSVETSCGCQLMMVVGIVILCWITMVVGNCSFNASHGRSTGLLLLWWWAVAVSMLHKKIRFIIITEDRLYYWKINCIIGRPIVVLEDRLYYWKIDCIIGRSIVMLEDQWKIDGIRRWAVLKTINWIRWKLPIKESNCKKMTT